MRFEILTIFPEFFDTPFAHGVLGRAVSDGVVEIAVEDLRRHAADKRGTVDDRPFGGGEGMVLKPEPIFAAARAMGIAEKAQRDTKRETVVMLSAQGRPLTQAMARELAGLERVTLLCGRYEGVDERVIEMLCDREISIGDYVLSGGELAAAVVVDAVVRLLPGVLGNADSNRYESFGAGDAELVEGETTVEGVPRAVHGAGGLLDYPHYTRPAEYEGAAVPEVLTGGDHAAVRRWRREAALRKTWRNRPELLEGAELSREERQLIEKWGRGEV